MAIDKQVFGELFVELQNYYKREMTAYVQGVWYKHLSRELTTVEFEEAVECAIASFSFLPTPEQLVAIIKGSRESQALQEWAIVLAASAGGDKARLELKCLSNRAQVALRTIGGIVAVEHVDGFQRPRLEKSFVAVYCQCSDRDCQMLSAATVKNPFGGQMMSEDPAIKVMSGPAPEEIKQRMRKLSERLTANKSAREEIDVEF